MTDGYVGLVRSPREENVAPIVTRCRISVEEISDSSGTYRSLTSAKFSITNLDIDPLSKTGITAIKVERNSFNDKESDYIEATTIFPSKWEVVGTFAISNNKELTGNNNSAVIIVPNIPANSAGYNHKFRLTFLNKDNIPARLIPFYDGAAYEPYVGEEAVDVFIGVHGAVESNGQISIDLDDTHDWDTNEFIGFSMQIYDSYNSPYYTMKTPIISNTTDDIVLLDTLPKFEESRPSIISKIRFEETIHFYILGDNATGVVFNGINDLSELVSVEGLQAEINSSWSSPDSSTPVVINKNSIKLRWKNMYKHAEIETLNGSGVAMNISKEWASIGGYGIYMYVANDSSLPSQGKFPGGDLEANGVWYKIDEIDDKHIPYEIQNYYEYIINDLPPGKNIGFWVGAFTPFTFTNVRSIQIRSVT